MSKIEGQENLKLFDQQNEKLLENQKNHQAKIQELDFKQRFNNLKFSQFMDENDKDYKDHVKWENQFVQEKKLVDDQKFWQKQEAQYSNKKSMLDYYKKTYDQTFSSRRMLSEEKRKLDELERTQLNESLVKF